MTGGEQRRRRLDGQCQAVALGQTCRPRPCPFWGLYEGLYGLVLCGYHLKVYERACTLGVSPRVWRDRLRGLVDGPEPSVAPAGPTRGIYQGFWAA